jgi:ATP-binding cassette subfamily F protein uup
VIDEYVGGYTDYLRQRPATAAVVAKKAAAPPPRPKERSATRLSYKDQRELDALPARIAALEKEKTALEKAMESPQTYAGGDRTKLADAARRHGELISDLAEAEEKWLELAERAEQAKG